MNVFMKKFFFWSLCIVTLTGCQSGYPVLLDSFPQSAMVICDQEEMGYTPMTVYYQKDDIEGSHLKDKCKAIWVSGDEKKYKTNIKIDDNKKGTKILVKRAKNSNNLSMDILFDYQRKKDIEAEKRRSAIDLIKSFQNKSTYCNKIGSQIHCNTY